MGIVVLSHKSFSKLILASASPIDIQEIIVAVVLPANVAAVGNLVNTMAADVLATHVARTSAAIILTHWGLVTPHGDKELSQPWLRQWLVAWQHQAITWTNVDSSSVRSLSIHLRALSLDDVKIPINKTRLKITFLKSHSDLPGANELTIQDKWFLVFSGKAFQLLVLSVEKYKWYFCLFKNKPSTTWVNVT